MCSNSIFNWYTRDNVFYIDNDRMKSTTKITIKVVIITIFQLYQITNVILNMRDIPPTSKLCKFKYLSFWFRNSCINNIIKRKNSKSSTAWNDTMIDH